MGLFNNNNRKNKHINALNKQEIENEITNKKQQIKQLKEEVSTTKKEIEKTNKDFKKQINDLEKQQETFTANLNAEKGKIDKAYTDLNDKKVEYAKQVELRNE